MILGTNYKRRLQRKKKLVINNKNIILFALLIVLLTLSVMGLEHTEHFSRVFCKFKNVSVKITYSTVQAP